MLLSDFMAFLTHLFFDDSMVYNHCFQGLKGPESMVFPVLFPDAS